MNFSILLENYNNEETNFHSISFSAVSSPESVLAVGMLRSREPSCRSLRPELEENTWPSGLLPVTLDNSWEVQSSELPALLNLGTGN